MEKIYAKVIILGKGKIIEWIEENEGKFTDIAMDIWNTPEIGYTEKFASAILTDTLANAGFKISFGVGDIPTAFIAEYGKGKPVIGVIGEYDALPGLSQQVKATRDPVEDNGPGHGCGHNLLGTAGVEAVISLKEAINTEKLKGTIRFYGCPAEELLSGKTFMARSGAFDDLDCAFSWHPYNYNIASEMRYLACTAIEFHFKGVSAHASTAPHLGRSALDSVEIMNVGANYLREHVTDDIRIHYQITNGGMSPNTVPDKASVYYFIRGENNPKVDEVKQRLIKVAQGAAMMNETTVNWNIKASVYDALANNTLNELMYQQTNYVEYLSYNQQEKNFAKSLYKASNNNKVPQTFIDPAFYFDKDEVVPVNGSTDIGDVSWMTPLGKIMVTSMPLGVQLHSWQATASFGSSIGIKGMHYAAKIMALSVYEIFKKPNNILEKAKKEFKSKTGEICYKSGIPDEVTPPVKNNL